MQINDAYDYAAHLIYCALHKETVQPLPENITYEQVLSCAVRHDVAGFAYLGVLRAENQPDSDTLNKWRERYMLGIQRNSLQNDACHKILDAFHAQEIPTLELQGTKVKCYYPSPDLRMMGDIDIIIEDKHIHKAEEILKSLGYDTVNQGDFEVDGRNGDIAVEIHTDFFTDSVSYHEIISNPFENAVVHEDFTATVPDTVFWTYHLLHCLKHYRGKGIGLRRILDLCILEPEMKKSVDIEYVNKIMDENGLTENINDLFAIAGYLFNNEETERDIYDSISVIKTAGTQGKLGIGINHKLKEMRTEGKHFLKLRYFISLAFPPKKQIYISYPFCKEHNYPYVFSWIHRAVRIPFKDGRLRLIKKYMHSIRKASAD